MNAQWSQNLGYPLKVMWSCQGLTEILEMFLWMFCFPKLHCLLHLTVRSTLNETGRSLEIMGEGIAARLAAESKEINDPICDTSAKNCHDKINNLDKKYKTVKDRSKLTGEGSEGIKSFQKFDSLDEIWGTRDSVNPKYVTEAGTSHTPTAPVASPSSSLTGSASNTTVIWESAVDEESP